VGIVEASVEIAEAPDLVFKLCSDFENELRWNLKAQKAVKVTSGRVGVGTRYRAKWRRSPEVEVECIAFDEAARTWTNHISRPIRLTSTFAVTPTRSGSLLSARFHADGVGIGKIYVLMLTRQMRRDIPRNMGLMKNLIERGAIRGD
jgi:uncharacterized protein YndB with AHSA1/START domain